MAGVPPGSHGLPGRRLNNGDFYEEYHGHKVEHLQHVRTRLLESGTKRFVYLAGDSSLDNKHWFFKGWTEKRDQVKRPSDFVGAAINGYEHALEPPFMVKDVAYWVNVECQARCGPGNETACLNTSIEESSMVQREETPGGLLPQDEFIRDNITEEDILVIDVGGNDIALRPTVGVIFNIALLLYLTPTFAIKAGAAPGLAYFVHMFRVRLRRYIELMIAKKKPKKVVVCMLYFLDHQSGGSWADHVLEKLGYDKDPEKLQAVIRKVYEWGVAKIDIPGVEICPLPLYETLDGTDTTDYCQRVEPSVTGGQKLGRAIAERAGI